MIYGSTDPHEDSQNFWRMAGTVPEIVARMRTDLPFKPDLPQSPQTGHRSPYVYRRALTADPNTWRETSREQVLEELPGNPMEKRSHLDRLEQYGAIRIPGVLYRCMKRDQSS